MLAIGSILSLMACSSTVQVPSLEELSPATLAAADPSIDASVRAVIASALSLTEAERDRILLSAPFTTSNILIIQRGGVTGANARAANGRIMTEPERFELLSSGQRCWVRHENTGQLFLLEAGECGQLAEADSSSKTAQ